MQFVTDIPPPQIEIFCSKETLLSPSSFQPDIKPPPCSAELFSTTQLFICNSPVLTPSAPPQIDEFDVNIELLIFTVEESAPIAP